MKSPFLSLVLAFGLGACAGPLTEPASAAPPKFVPAAMVHDVVPGSAAVARVSPQPFRKAPPAEPPVRERGTPVSRVAAANRTAVREPSADGYANAVQVYPWSEGVPYRLYAAPERVSDIALQPGESLISVAAGDTARWIVGDTASGAGARRRAHVLVKPTAPGLSTNLVIATDRRVYHVALESTRDAAMAGIAWTYPQGELLAVRGEDRPMGAVAAGVTIEALDFGYAIEGDDPPWRPLRAFDDGQQVFIEFPASFAQGKAPPLFVRGEGGRAELVNYRLRGRYYVVDRLFAEAELRLGEKRQQVVRIVRADDARRRRGGRSS